MILDFENHQRWVNDDGDYKHNLNHILNEDSIVMDLGAYTGVWAQQIINIYNPFVYLIEPIQIFYKSLENNFCNNEKVKMLNVGISNKNESGKLYLHGDSTSKVDLGSGFANIQLLTFESILNYFNLSKVDLLQINIKGEEYTVLEHILTTPTTCRKVEKFQIQFHKNVDGYEEKRNYIHSLLKANNYEICFNYPFVWEAWELKNN